jgi:hypothetical protein
MSATTVAPRKLVVTRALYAQFVRLAENRNITARKTDKSALLTQCREIYWKKYPHWYRRAGKAIANVLNPHMARRGRYDDFAAYMDSLSDIDIQRAVDEIKRRFFPQPTTPAQPTPNPVAAIPVQPAPQQTQQDAVFGEKVARPGATTGTTNNNYVDQGYTTAITLDPVPTGFQDPSPYMGITPNKTSTDRQHQLMAKLRQALMAVSQCRTVRGMEDGDLDMERLTDIGAGINLSGLFQRVKAGRRLSVAVQIYGDVSMSMDHRNGAERRCDRQFRLCVALGTVLERLRVPFQIIFYDDRRYMMKDFQTRLCNSAMWKFPLRKGNTDLPNAMLNGLPMLMGRREDRKLAIVITDGDIGADVTSPMRKVSDRHGNLQTVYPPMMLKIRKKYPKLETCGFGIEGTEIPTDAFDYMLQGLGTNLVEAVSNQVVKVIVGQRHHH